MGKRDNRRSMKMRRKVRQRKLKTRIKKRKESRAKKPAASGGKAPKKSRTSAAPAGHE